ncbi:hypothetical protein NYY89_20735, partial [Acinetobacter baumannii]|nr:hypothetical protein [Acinetobacter baumannii]
MAVAGGTSKPAVECTADAGHKTMATGHALRPRRFSAGNPGLGAARRVVVAALASGFLGFDQGELLC